VRKTQIPLLVAYLVIALFCGEIAIVAPTHAQNPPEKHSEAAPQIKLEDKSAIADIEIEILTNQNSKMQLESAYKEIVAQRAALDARLTQAKASALKNAGADPEKFDVDENKRQIVAKPAPAPPTPAAKPKE
jgi:hypothetical protein